MESLLKLNYSPTLRSEFRNFTPYIISDTRHDNTLRYSPSVPEEIQDRVVVAARAAARLSRFVAVGLAEIDLSLSQYRLLAFLDDGGTAQTELVQRLSLSGPSVTALVEGLVSRGYVKRKKDPQDGRRTALLLTHKGRETLQEADTAVAARLFELGSYLDTNDAKAAVRGLELADQAIRRHREASSQ